MFGGVQAMKEDLQDQALVRVACSHSKGAMSTSVMRKLGELYASKAATGSIDYSLPTDYFQHLERKLLLEKNILWVNDFKETRFTTEGLDLACDLADVLPRKNAVVVYQPISLQNTIRNARSDLQAVVRAPEDFRWFWRNLMWRFRIWWQGTNPEVRIIDGGELVPVKLWTKEDEQRNYQQWLESHYTAFWLCPGGVDEGIRMLDEFNTKCKADGVNAQVLDAVAQFARDTAKLPEKVVGWRIEQMTPAEIAEKYARKAREYEEELNELDRFEEEWNNAKKLTNQVLGKPGIGKTYSVTQAQNEAFIRVFDNKVDAAESAIELADQAATDAVKAQAKGRKKKPAQFVIIDDFCKTFDELTMKEARDDGKTIREIAQDTKRSPQAVAAHMKAMSEAQIAVNKAKREAEEAERMTKALEKLAGVKSTVKRPRPSVK